MKRVLGAAALGGGLLALSAGAAGAQEASAEVRVCADGRVLSGLLGSCSSSGASITARAGRGDTATGVRVRARVPGTADADVSIGTRRSRPAAGQASTTRPRPVRADVDASAETSPRPRADASASLARRARPLLDLDGTVSLAGVGLLGSSPFTLAGDMARSNLPPAGDLTLDDPTGDTPAGIGIGTDTSTGGIIAAPPGTTSPGGTDGGDGPGSSTGTSEVPGTQGLPPGSGGAAGADGSVTTSAPPRPAVAGSGALPFTGAAGDLLGLVAFALLIAGALVVRATRPAAATEGGDDR
ncbi:MAG TPA: hypothetical protein VFN05_11140 [Actinomycetes bacterium]|nr:hypothetical protein [Actinomycetes bacterium]